jgi:ketosteroid isomerase-like protein
MSNGVADAVRNCDQEFLDALVAADARRLGEVVDSDFLIVDVTSGAVTNRADFIALVESGQVVFKEVESFPSEAILRQFENTVVMIGRTRMSFTTPDGHLARVSSRYTHVFAATPSGNWQLVSAQGTALPEGA